MIDDKIGGYIREARTKRGVKQNALATALGIPQSFLSQIEKGGRTLPDHLFAKLPNRIRYRVIAAMLSAVKALR